MATTSLICKENKDGTLTGIYCGHDSYIEWVGKLLFENYNTIEKLEELLSNGDTSTLEQKLENCGFYCKVGEEDTQAKTYKNIEILLNEWEYIDFLYIFTQSGKWIVYENFGDKRQIDLEEALKNLKGEQIKWSEKR